MNLRKILLIGTAGILTLIASSRETPKDREFEQEVKRYVAEWNGVLKKDYTNFGGIFEQGISSQRMETVSQLLNYYYSINGYEDDLEECKERVRDYYQHSQDINPLADARFGDNYRRGKVNGTLDFYERFRRYLE